MFDFGTKVTVLASSTKRSLGPRYGSIGYVVTSGSNLQYVEDTNFINGAVVAPTEILFIRYGFEKSRPQAERKEILNVFPILRKPAKEAENLTVLQRTESAIKKFNKEDFDDSTWYHIKSSLLSNPDSSNVCIMSTARVYGEDLMTCSVLEFKAWFESYLMSYEMKAILSKMTNKRYASRFPKQELRKYLSVFKECASSKIARNERGSDIATNKTVRKEVIEALRLVKAVAYTRQRDNLRKHVNYGAQNNFYIDGSGYLRPEVFFPIAVHSMFTDEFNWRRERLLNTPMKNKRIILDRLSQTKDALLFLADVAFRKGGQE